MVDSQKKILNKRVFRECRANIRSYLSIILITILCVSLFTGLFANHRQFKENVNSMYEKSNIADIFATLKPYAVNIKNGEQDERFDELLSKKDELEFDSVEKRLYSDAYAMERKLYLSVLPNDNNEISRYANISSGDYPATNGVLLTESFAKRRHYKVGDTIDVTVKISLKSFFPNDDDISKLFKDSVLPGKTDIYNDSEEMVLTYTITGIMSHAESMGNLASSPGMLYMNRDTFAKGLFNLIDENYKDSIQMRFIKQFIKEKNIYNQYLFKGGNIDKIRNYLQSSNSLNYIANRSLMPSTMAVETDVEQSLSLCYVFPIIFYIVGVLVIIASTTKQIDKDKQYIGMMSAIGVSKSTIIMHYVKISMMLVGIGGILGLIIGPNLIPAVMGIKYNVLYKIPETKHQIFYLQYFLCFIVLFVITLFITILLSRKYVFKNPIDVIRDNSSKPFYSSIFERIGFINKRMSYSLKMALRNIKRRMSRSILVIVGVLGCSALLICGFGIEDTLNYGLDLELNEKITYDNEVVFNAGTISKEEIYAANSNIEYVEAFQLSVVMISFNDSISDTNMVILEPNSKCYRIDCPDEGVTLSKKLADSIGVKLGDTITIHHANQAYDMKVTNIISLFLSQGIYMRSNDSIPFEVKPNRYYCTAKPGSDLYQISEDLELLENVHWSNPIYTKINTANNALSSIRTITLVVKVFAILLAITVVYNLAVLNFKERTREIATMKVLGYGYKDSCRMLIYEILILSFIGGIIGMFLGYPLLYAVMSINEPPLINYIYHINWYTYLISLLITCGVSVVINLLISIKIKSIPMVESLKSVE